MSRASFAPELTEQPWSDAVGYRSEFDGLRGCVDPAAGDHRKAQADAAATAPAISSLSSDSAFSGSRLPAESSSRYWYGPASSSTPRGSEDSLLASMKRRAATGTGGHADHSGGHLSSPDLAKKHERQKATPRPLPPVPVSYAYGEDVTSNPWADVPVKLHFHEQLAGAVRPRTDNCPVFPPEGIPGSGAGPEARPLDLSASGGPPAVEREAQLPFAVGGPLRENEVCQERWERERPRRTSGEVASDARGADKPSAGHRQARKKRPTNESSNPRCESGTAWQADEDPWRG